MNIDKEYYKYKLSKALRGAGEMISSFAELPIGVARFVYRRILIDREPAYIVFFAFELAVVCYFATLRGLVGWEMSKHMIWLGISYVVFTFASIELEDRLECHMTEHPLMLTQVMFLVGTFMILFHNL